MHQPNSAEPKSSTHRFCKNSDSPVIHVATLAHAPARQDWHVQNPYYCL